MSPERAATTLPRSRRTFRIGVVTAALLLVLLAYLLDRKSVV